MLSGGFDIMFGVAFIIVTLGFVFVFGSIIASAVRKGRQWKRDEAAPVLTVDATVVTKRADVSHRHHHRGAGGHTHHSTSSTTTYYTTFQVASGDRMELEVQDTEYGLLVEGDRGRLTFQGSRYQGFTRV